MGIPKSGMILVTEQEKSAKLDFVECFKLGENLKWASNFGWAYLQEFLQLGAAILHA